MKMRFVFATALVALALVACGGGGGGESPAPITPTTPTVATGSFTSVNGCTVPDGQSICSAAENWTTKDATTVSVTLNGVQVSTLAAGPATMTLTSGNNTITLLGDGKTLDSKVVVGACADGTAADTNKVCRATALKYTDRVLAVWTNGYLYMVTKTGVTAAVNQTSYQAGAIPLGNCTAPNKPLPDGNIPSECTAASDLQRHKVQWNPLTNVVTNYTGTFPADITFVSAENNSTQPVAGTTSARVADGWFYSDPAARWVLKFQADAGGTTTVKAGTFAADGSIKVLRAYSN